MTTETPAHQARARLEIEGRAYDVIDVDGEESINLGFYFQVALLGQPHDHNDTFIGRRFTLQLSGRDGDARLIAGTVTEALEDLNPAERKRFTLSLKPHFRHLELTRGPVLWIGLDFKGLVKALLAEAGAQGGRVDFDFNSDHPVHPWQLRGVNENSRTMLARHLAKEGIFCWVDSLEGEERLTFADHNANCPYVRGGALRPVPEVGMEAMGDGHPQVGIYTIEAIDSLQPGAAIGYIHPQGGPVRPQTSDPRASARPGMTSGFGMGAATLDEATHWAKLVDDYHDQQAHQLHIRANRVDLAPGHCLTLESEGHSGDYLITRVRHRTAQAAGLSVRGATLPYTCEAWLTPRVRPYRSPMPPKRPQPDIIEARLVSNSPYASLDAAGRYKVRALFEPGQHAFGRKTEGEQTLRQLRRLTPHAGPKDPFGQPTGFHPPGLDDAPVLLSCLNDDPDRLCVLGGTYDPSHRSPVTCDNLTENLYRSVNHNTLLMDDRKAQELIRLHPIDGILYLELNAKKAAHWAGLVTKEGAIDQHAGKVIAFKSGDSHTELIDNDRIQQVENRSVTKTQKGKIHHQAGRDIQLAAGESIHIEAGQDVEITAGGDFKLSAEQDAVFQIKQGDQLIKVERGEVFIQAARDIWIEGDGSGPITLAQQDGGVEIDTQGNMTLFGKAFSADFAEVSMSGMINYEVPGSAPAPKLNLRQPLEPVAIEDLVDPREPLEKRIEQETVALVPVRYAVDKRAEGEQACAYSAANLAQDLPELAQARYVLRRPRMGWLYLLLNGKLYQLEIDENASLIPEPERKAELEAAKVSIESQALLLPKAAGQVWLAYSEHPWTDKQKSAMEAGTNRHQQMQRFQLNAPGQDALKLDEIADQVVDYGGPGGDFSWSDVPNTLTYDSLALRSELLYAANGGQQAVALHDPIGIGRDLSNLLCHDILERETLKAQALHKRQSAIAALNLIDSAKPTEEKIAARTKTLYDEAMGRSGGPVGLIKQPKDFKSAAEAQLQDEQDKLIARLRVQPDDLRRYLDSDLQDLKPLTTQIETRGKDACHWLRNCPDQLIDHHLDAYDLTDIPTALAYEDAVTGCQGGLCETQEGRELISEWLLRNPIDSPYWKAIAAGNLGLLEELEGISSAGDKLNTSLNVYKKTARLWIAIQRADKAAEATHTLQSNSNTEQLALSASAIVSARFRQTGQLDAEMESVMQQMRLIALGRVGVQLQDVYASHGDINAAILRNFLAESASNNGHRLTPLSQAMREAMKKPQTKIETTTFKVSHQGETRVWVVARAEETNHPIPKDKAPPSQPAEQMTDKAAIADAFDLEKIKTYSMVGVTGVLAFFSVVNLVSVLNESPNPDTAYISRRKASWLALGSAALSFVDASADAIHLMQGKPETGFIAEKYMAPRILGRISVKMLVKFGATTVGAAVSFYEATIAGDKAGKLQKSKDPDAARAYFHQRTAHLWAGGLGVGAASATFASGALAGGAEASALALGASAILAGAAVVLLVASFIAIGVAVYYGVQGEKLTDGPVDVWLDRCWWGRHEQLKQLKPYSNVTEETQGYFELSYTPQILADWSDRLSSFNLDDLDITIYLPGYQPGKSSFYLLQQINLLMPGRLNDVLPDPEPVDKLVGVYRLKLPTLKVKDGSAVSMTFRYFPDEVELPGQMIQITKTFKDD
jgi:uncharacterized protein involved in type VI secretion and phage assembly